MEPTAPVAPAAAVGATEAPEKGGVVAAATEVGAVATPAEVVARTTMTGIEKVLMCSIRTPRVFKTCLQQRVQDPDQTQPIDSHK